MFLSTLFRPLLDFLLLILFLPSLLTLLTVLSQRFRILRQQKRDRAPAEAVARLPIFLWGDTEKASDPSATDPSSLATPRPPHDEESAIGADPASASASSASESTPLLRPASLAPRSVLERARIAFPRLSSRRASAGASAERAEAKAAPPGRLRVRFHTTECAICLSEFVKGERVMMLPCGHVFHAGEICDWLLESRRLVSILESGPRSRFVGVLALTDWLLLPLRFAVPCLQDVDYRIAVCCRVELVDHARVDRARRRSGRCLVASKVPFAPLDLAVASSSSSSFLSCFSVPWFICSFLLLAFPRPLVYYHLPSSALSSRSRALSSIRFSSLVARANTMTPSHFPPLPLQAEISRSSCRVGEQAELLLR